MLEQMIAQLTDDELKKCFKEIQGWRKTGTFDENALIRKLWNEFRKTISTYPIHEMSEPILYEIAKRHYK